MSDDSVVSSEISIEDFEKVDIRFGNIKNAETIPGAKKLLKLTVNFVDFERTIVAGIAQKWSCADLIGRTFAFVVNLKPITLRGVESHGMILACGAPDSPTGPNDASLALAAPMSVAGSIAFGTAGQRLH